GVSLVLPGYSGGKVENPTYDEVSGGNTGHAEVIYIEYDPEQVDYKTLLVVFFGSHDPTTLNRQGNDVGTQYRSVIFYTNERQRQIAEEMVKSIEGAVTEIVKLDKFYKAEDYHENYYARNKNAPYC